jgi:CheY-like chemotaxis protein
MAETVLIVDDELSVRRGLKSLLESLGLTVTTTDGVTQAEAALESSQFALILADLNLSRSLDGREGLQVIDVARRLGHREPVIMFTAHGSEEVRQEALRRGANDLWSKSLPIDELVARVLSLTKRLG